MLLLSHITWLESLFILALGLIDEGETVEQAAIRELEEETGFKSDKILDTSDLLASDPGNDAIVSTSVN